MFKKFSLSFVLVLLLGVFIGGGQAQSATFSRLANLLPMDTFAYIEVDLSVEALDVYEFVFKQMAETTPDTAIETLTPRESLSEAIMQSTGGKLDLESGVLSWLGDSAVIATNNTDRIGSNDGTYVLVESRVSRDELVAILDVLLANPLANGSYTKETIGSNVYYMSLQNYNLSYGVFDDFLMMASTDTLRNFTPLTREARFAQNPRFIQALEALPTQDNHVFAYFDATPIMASGLSEVDAQAFEMLFGERLTQEQLASSAGALMFTANFTDTEIWFDFGVVAGETSADELLRFPVFEPVALPPINPDFMRYAPANSVFYIQSAGVGQYAQAIWDYLPRALVAISENYGGALGEMEGREAVDALRQLPGVLNVAANMFEDELGVSLTNFFGAISGQMAGFITIRAGSTWRSEEIYPQVAFYVETQDKSTQDILFNKLNETLERTGATFSNQNGLITVTTNADQLQHVYISNTDELFLFATDSAYDAVIKQREERLSIDMAQTLPNSFVIGMVNLNEYRSMAFGMTRQQNSNPIMRVFDHIVFSAGSTGGGKNPFMRWVMTINQ